LFDYQINKKKQTSAREIDAGWLSAACGLRHLDNCAAARLPDCEQAGNFTPPHTQAIYSLIDRYGKHRRNSTAQFLPVKSNFVILRGNPMITTVAHKRARLWLELAWQSTPVIIHRMSDLFSRLKALGVQVGTQNLPPAHPRQDFPISKVVPGRIIDSMAGQTFVTEQFYPKEYLHGTQPLALTSALDVVARWAHTPAVANMRPEALAFLDTETSGLAGGTGTYAFLVGVGRYEGEGFRLAQFFMRDPTEEPAMLLALEEFLAPCRALVTFNGKSFDAPLLNTRYTLQGWRSPLRDLEHVDLLHLARRIWRDRMPSRTLGNLEVQILNTNRTTEEVPGWMIPEMYFDYLRTGDARPMKNVLYHNQMDVVSMAALLRHTAMLLTDPLKTPNVDISELAALARLYEELGEIDQAERFYCDCLERGMPEPLFWDSLERLSFLYKRAAKYELAIPLWEKAARQGLLYAHEELAKFYEHIGHDPASALKWTEQALALLDTTAYSSHEHQTWQPELIHRRERLTRKLT
jgi:hypothetical protein